MKQITIRNVDEKLDKELKKESRRRGQSVNGLVLQLLRRAVGLSPEHQYDNGLSELAGTWNDEDLEEFKKTQEVFKKIDEELWR